VINASEEHAHLCDLAANIMGAANKGGVCAADWPRVRLRQTALARALAHATPKPAPLVLMSAITAKGLADGLSVGD
jgi:hypothetical protein